MPDMPMDVQERRRCARCHQVDDHPRHGVGVVAGTGAQPASFHMDCHAQLGCPTCLASVEASGGARGAALTTHLLSLINPVLED